MIGDVCGGSETPSMVRKVLAWKREGGDDAVAQWLEVARHNERIEQSLRRLKELASADPPGYDAAIQACSQMTAETWPTEGVGAELAALRHALFDARVGLKRIGEQADVPIEPESQTRLANATAACAGVIGAGVPGGALRCHPHTRARVY